MTRIAMPHTAFGPRAGTEHRGLHTPVPFLLATGNLHREGSPPLAMLFLS